MCVCLRTHTCVSVFVHDCDGVNGKFSFSLETPRILHTPQNLSSSASCVTAIAGPEHILWQACILKGGCWCTRISSVAEFRTNVAACATQAAHQRKMMSPGAKFPRVADQLPQQVVQCHHRRCKDVQEGHHAQQPGGQVEGLDGRTHSPRGGHDLITRQHCIVHRHQHVTRGHTDR